jgi:hypothetical protein
LSENRPSINTKQELIEYTSSAWDAFVAYVDRLTDDQWIGLTDAAGWSVKDHVSHVTKWDRAVIDRLRNRAPLEESLGISDDAWSADSFDPMNEEIRQLAVNDSVQMVKAECDATWTDLLKLLGELNEDQLVRDGADAGLGIGRRPLSEPVLQVLVEYLGAHYGEHLRYIRFIIESEAP